MAEMNRKSIKQELSDLGIEVGVDIPTKDLGILLRASRDLSLTPVVDEGTLTLAITDRPCCVCGEQADDDHNCTEAV